MSLNTPKRLAAALLLCASSTAMAGPVILGGDDLTDHGSRSSAGLNLQGWLYIEKAVNNVLGGQTRAGAITTDIVALGSASTLGVFTGSDAGAAIGSAALNLGRTVTYIDGAAAINLFFTNLAAGTINPRMLWIAGNGATNDIDSAEGAALTANAAAINTFVASGGGLMSHGSGPDVYGWLTTLLPGISEVLGSCNSTGATLTAAGQAAFPGLSNSNVDANAGPCHSSFTGNFGGLTTLAFDGDGRSYIIGGGGGTLIQCGQPGQPACPPSRVPEPGTLPLLGLGAVAFAWVLRRRRVSAV